MPGVPTYAVTYDRGADELGEPALVGHGPPVLQLSFYTPEFAAAADVQAQPREEPMAGAKLLRGGPLRPAPDG